MGNGVGSSRVGVDVKKSLSEKNESPPTTYLSKKSQGDLNGRVGMSKKSHKTLTVTSSDRNSNRTVSAPNVFESLVEGHDVLISNERARIAFMRFIQKKSWLEDLTRPLAVARKVSTFQSSDGGIKFQNYTVAPKSRRLSYLEPAEHFMERVNLIQKLKISATKYLDTFDKKSQQGNACFSPKAMQCVVLATLYGLFVQTQEYETAINFVLEEEDELAISVPTNESNKSMFLDSMKTPSSTVGMNSGSPVTALSLSTRLVPFRRSSSKGRIGLKSPDYRHIELLYGSKLDSLSDSELEALLVSGDWVAEFLGAIDGMNRSLCVSTAPADTSVSESPLVYVNHTFEQLTQYSRAEMMEAGSCAILHTSASEKETIAAMQHSVAHGEPCKVAVCNTRKDGTEFVNFVSLLPVYVSGQYRYVVGVHYDATAEEASIKDIKLTEDFLLIVANLLR